MVHARAALAVLTGTLVLGAAPLTGLAHAHAGAGEQSARAAAKRCVTKKARGRKVRTCKPKPRRVAAPRPQTVVEPVFKVEIELLPGSSASVEIPALALPGGQLITGTGITREVPLTGGFTGAFENGVRLMRDITVRLERGEIRPGAVDVLSDPACGGAPTLRLNPFSSVGLDRTRRTLAVLNPKGGVSASAFVLMRLAFDMRVEPGCDKPLVSVGYADTPFAVKVGGALGDGGLRDFSMQSQPTAVTVAVCLTPGPADQACGGGGPAAYPVKITVRLRLAVSLSV